MTDDLVERVAAMLRDKLEHSGNHSDEDFREAAAAAIAMVLEVTE